MNKVWPAVIRSNILQAAQNPIYSVCWFVPDYILCIGSAYLPMNSFEHCPYQIHSYASPIRQNVVSRVHRRIVLQKAIRFHRSAPISSGPLGRTELFPSTKFRTLTIHSCFQRFAGSRYVYCSSITFHFCFLILRIISRNPLSPWSIL